MPNRLSPAQRVFQITFVLKGDLKNIQIAIVRAAARLAQVRDEKLYRVIGHDTMEEYAAERLGLQRAMLYRYLQIYDWLRKWHPEWLARRPKGFIPDLSDLYELIWIEGRLSAPPPAPSSRRCARRRSRESSPSASSRSFATAGASGTIRCRRWPRRYAPCGAGSRRSMTFRRDLLRTSMRSSLV